MAGKFEIDKTKSGNFIFRLKAGNGQIILASESYSEKRSALAGVESVRKNSANADRFEKKVSSAGEPYFNLKSTNGQVIGKSEMYSSEAARDNGIQSVMSNAPEAKLVDLTEAEA